jgi:anti-sigma factor RsiW
MRCDTSERFFEGLLDGTLPPRQRVELEAHLAGCTRCAGLLEELRVIDALLLTPRTIEPPPNFTFKTMAEIRSLPAPKPVRQRWLWMFSLYLVLSWTAIAAWIAIGRPDANAALALAFGFLGHLGGALDGIAKVAGTGFGLGYAGVAGLVTSFLLLDLAVLCCALFVRAVFRQSEIA